MDGNEVKKIKCPICKTEMHKKYNQKKKKWDDNRLFCPICKKVDLIIG